MIEVKNVCKDYGHYRAVDNVSFSMEKGEILGFLGPNGAGKTTLMRILTCFFPPTQGKAMVAGYDCFEDSLNVRKKIGYLPERVPLYEDMSVFDYLTFVAGIKGTPAKEVKKRVARVMDDCGLDTVSKRMIGNLSRGYRQRAGLAQALINDPQVLILDEPTVGLDPKQIKEIRKLINELAGRRTVILSTHILPEVSLLCQKIVIINEGKLIAADTPENLTAGLKSESKLFLRINGDAVEIEKELSQIDGIKSVSKDKSDSHGFIVEFEKGKDPRQQIHSAIIANKRELMEMRSQEISLEDIFIKLVTKEERT